MDVFLVVDVLGKVFQTLSYHVPTWGKYLHWSVSLGRISRLQIRQLDQAFLDDMLLDLCVGFAFSCLCLCPATRGSSSKSVASSVSATEASLS